MTLKIHSSHLAVHLAFICSLRIGETVGLTWDDIDFEKNLIRVHPLQRVSRESLQFIPQDDSIHIFPSKIANTNSTLVLKLPKTANSNRIIYRRRPSGGSLCCARQWLQSSELLPERNTTISI